MDKYWDWLNKNSGGFQFVAILIALFAILDAWIREKRSKFKQKRNILEAVRLELNFDKQWINNLIPQGQNVPQYYDPTRADFRLRDDAVNYAITNGQSVLLSEQGLLKKLIEVSHAVRFVNQQIEEQTMVRFCSPEFSSKMSSLVIKNNQIINQWCEKPDSIPEELKQYADELRLRHWALNNIGFWRELKPALDTAIPVVEGLIGDMDTSKKWWHFWKG